MSLPSHINHFAKVRTNRSARDRIREAYTCTRHANVSSANLHYTPTRARFKPWMCNKLDDDTEISKTPHSSNPDRGEKKFFFSTKFLKGGTMKKWWHSFLKFHRASRRNIWLWIVCSEWENVWWQDGGKDESQRDPTGTPRWAPQLHLIGPKNFVTRLLSGGKFTCKQWI